MAFQAVQEAGDSGGGTALRQRASRRALPRGAELGLLTQMLGRVREAGGETVER